MNDFFSEIVTELAGTGIESPRLEARRIFAFVQKKEEAEIYAGCAVTEAEKQKIKVLCDQRKKHCPLDKLLGKKGFYKNEFITGKDVLSPRPDTELLVEKALELLPSDSTEDILDLGTGSGCIVESILAERPYVQGVAVDISAAALEIAQRNAVNLQVDKRLRFINASWFDTDFLGHFAKSFRLIVSNPPYIPQAEIQSLEPEVREYDPIMALDGGKSGFDCYIRIAELIPELLADGGFILLEAGKGQAYQIAEIYKAAGLKLIQIAADLAGTDRCVILQK